MGVTTPKKIMPITIGDTKLPKSFPKLIHTLFKGVRIFELNIPKIKKIKDITTDQILILSELIIGHKPIIINTKKKSKPKLRFEGNF